MPEKGSKVLTPQWSFRSKPIFHWRFGLLVGSVFLGMLVVWSIDGCTVNSLVSTWNSKRDYHSVKVENFTQNHQNLTLNASLIPQTLTLTSSNLTHSNKTQDLENPYPITQNFTQITPNHTRLNKTQNLENPNPKSQNFSSITQNQTHFSKTQNSFHWISVELDTNFTDNLIARSTGIIVEPCEFSKTVEISIPDLENKDSVTLSAGEVHEFAFQTLDEFGKLRCSGGDYFEADLSGESWKSRPPIKDLNNGSYVISLQVHEDFIGDYNLTMILLYRHFDGLRYSSGRFVYDRQIRQIKIKFLKSKDSSTLARLSVCETKDFYNTRNLWFGRWTRLARNDGCEISKDGRYYCLDWNYQCKDPWCIGSVGLLESNGWVYSSQCSFKIFTGQPAWDCLKNRWIFFWGDSNHVDTIRNMLNFIMGLKIESVPRRFDMNFTNPSDPTQSVRITSIFNGHWNETMNYQGLNSLRNDAFRDLVTRFFTEEKSVPDTVIINSGLHDGIFWKSVKQFSFGADYAAAFWADVLERVRKRGLPAPEVFFRSTVATGGYARSMQFNPSKMEAFNGVFLEKLRKYNVVSGFIDDFDMTFSWHFDNRCNDGVHYGRAPAKMRWRDGQIGHQYFVDLMLCHVLLNAMCSTR
ncbi:hypothetical protein RJ641_021191 [Dillenia turbinata]|uniref:Uncharacterized protein n=1 Tax=Dillenia turbinata TaxID=194707 RepID=A0AAN8UE95_9MAGN